MKNILIMFISTMFLFTLSGCKADSDSTATADEQPTPLPPKTQLKKLSLSSISNLGIKASSQLQSSISYSTSMKLTANSTIDSTADSGMITVDTSGDLQPVEQLGGISIFPELITIIKNSEHVFITYSDTTGDRETYLIDSSDDAHLLEFSLITMDGLKNGYNAFSFAGNYFYKNSQNSMIKGYFDSSGDYQEKILFNDLVYFALDRLGNFMIAANDNVYVAYRDYETSGYIWTIDGGSRFEGIDARESKLFFENNILFEDLDAGGFVFWDDTAGAFWDVYLGPSCTNDPIFCRSEKQRSAYGMNIPEPARSDCQQQYIGVKNWILCNGTAFNARGINQAAISHSLSYTGIDTDTAKRAASDRFLYFGTGSKLVRADLDNQVSTTLIEGYDIESLTVSSNDEILFSGKNSNGRNVLIKIKSDSSISEVDLQGNTISQIKSIK